MRQYCPGQPMPKKPGYSSIRILLGHTKLPQDIILQINKWLADEQISIMLTPIQDKKAQQICWLVYTTKQTNCGDLATAITKAIGLPMAAHFKQIIPGRKVGTKASTVHLMVVAQHTKDAMQWLKQIYGETHMTEAATKFPLGQWLLLAPLATKLNKRNLDGLEQLLKNKPYSVKKSHWYKTTMHETQTKNLRYKSKENQPNGHWGKSWCNLPILIKKNVLSFMWSTK